MSASGRRRVVITGVGAVTPLGNDVRSSWEQLVAGRRAAGPITAFDTTGFAVTFACEAKGFEPTQWIERKQARRMDRFAQLVVSAAHQARADAGLEVEQECDRVGGSVATAMGGLKSFEDACETLIKRGPGRVNPFAIPTIIPNMGAAQISIELGTKGPLTSQCTACAASTMAIGDGLDAIRLGRANVVLAGAGEAPSVWSWGRGVYGGLGVTPLQVCESGDSCLPEPTQIEGVQVWEIAAGRQHSLAIQRPGPGG